MAKKASPTELSSSELNEESSSEEQQARKSSKRRSKRNSIKNYVTDVLTKHDKDDGHPTDLTKTEITIDTSPDGFREHEATSAFRQYPSKSENAQRRQGQNSSSDEELRGHTVTEQVKKYLF